MSLIKPLQLHARHPSYSQARPILELIWAPLLGALSLLFDEYSDPRLLGICLAGFGSAAALAAALGVGSIRDVFVNSLCNFTGLHRWVRLRALYTINHMVLFRAACRR